MAHEPERERARRGLPSHVQGGPVARMAIGAIRAVRRALMLAVEILVAIVIVFEEWGWQPLAAGLARLARLSPLARLEAMVQALPPWPALAVFLVPSVLFLPLKLASLWLIGGGHLVAATALFAFAKVAGTALYARIFQLTQPALMRLAWFAALYNWFVPWKERIVAHAKATRVWQIGAGFAKAVKTRVRTLWRERLKPMAVALLGRLLGALRR
jgi:hypothetical protein